MQPMSSQRRALCLTYAAIAGLALLGTWHQNVAYLVPGEGIVSGFAGATVRFWKETFVTPAARSITIDIFALSLALVVFMLIEARRLRIRFVWLYVVFGLLVAISFTFPLFLVARERKRHQAGELPPELTTADLTGLAVFGGPIVLGTLWTLIP